MRAPLSFALALSSLLELSVAAAPSRFLTENTQQFLVKAVPDYDQELGESYAGVLPISSNPNEERKLWYWFFPTINPNPKREVVIWLDGGPGCSSLLGFLTQNGPFTWPDGTEKPAANLFDWRNLTHVIWVDQPVGTGFSQGTADIHNEEELAKEFVGFYEQLVKTYDLAGYDVYLTGESYAAVYITYIADEIIKRNNPAYPLKGVNFHAPVFGSAPLTQGVTVEPFVVEWQHYLGIDQKVYDDIVDRQHKCGFDDYLDKWFKFPPAGPLPELPELTDDCNIGAYFQPAAQQVNPCFSIYRIDTRCPRLSSVTYQGSPNLYFAREDVQKAINAPITPGWEVCTSKNVFVDGDYSDLPADSDAFVNVIEHTKNVMIGSGRLDALFTTNGTLLALQNVTWDGAQGLSEYPGKPLRVPPSPDIGQASPSGSGVLGCWTSERGVTFYAVNGAGHGVIEGQPGVGYRALEILLGRVSDFGSDAGFTTLQ